MSSKDLDPGKKSKVGQEKNRGTRDEFEIVTLIVAELPHLRNRILEHLEAAKARSEKQQSLMGVAKDAGDKGKKAG